MVQKFKVGILDDDSTKVTQIIASLTFWLNNISPEKKSKYTNYELIPCEIAIHQNIQNIINDVIEQKLDCVLVDYNLSSFEVVNFTGIEFARQLESVLDDFPIFILTSYEDDLFNKEIYNAYQVFDLNRYLTEDSEKSELNFKIIEQILKNEKQKKQWESEIISLLPLAGTSEKIDSRILELDTKVEKSINKRHALSSKIKKELNKNKLEELLEKIDILIAKE